jgi:TP901 family phage tail tape measure protein
MIQIGLEFKEMSHGFKKVESKIKGFEKMTMSMSKVVFGAFASIGLAAVTGLGVAVKKAAEFEQEMKRVKAITNATDEEFKQLQQTIIGLSNKTGISTSEIAHGMQEMAKFGFDAQKIMKVMPDVLNATIATGKDFATVLKVVEGALSEFGLKAEDTTKVVDVLTKVSFRTRADITKMGEAFKYAAPLAKQLGVSMEDTAAMTGLMVNAGFEGGIVGRTLRAAFTRLAGPTDKAASLMSQLRIQTKKANGDMLPMIQILENIRQSTQNMGNAQKVATLKTIFGMEAQSGMIAVMERGGDAIQKMSEELQKSGGITEEVAREMNDTFIGALNRANARISNLLTLIGAPFADALKGLLNDFNDTFDKIFGENLEKLPDMLQGIKDKVIQFGKDLIDGMAANDFIEEVKRRMEDAKNFIVEKWDALVTKFDEVMKKIKDFWDKHGGSIKLAINAVLMEISSIWDTTWELLKDTFNTVWIFISDAFDFGLDLILDALAVFADIINGDWDKLWKDLGKMLNNAWNNITKLLGNTLGNLAKLAFKWGGKLISMLIDGIKSKFKDLAEAAASAAKTIAKFLGINSPSEAGPLHFSDKWMPNFMEMLSNGIEMGIPKVEDSVVDVSKVISQIGNDKPNQSNVSNVNNVNVYPQQSNINSRQLIRELNRISILGGAF